jgi:hypothetical protein
MERRLALVLRGLSLFAGFTRGGRLGFFSFGRRFISGHLRRRRPAVRPLYNGYADTFEGFDVNSFRRAIKSEAVAQVDYLCSVFLKCPRLLEYFIRAAVAAAAAGIKTNQLYGIVLFKLAGLFGDGREAIPTRAPFTVLIAPYNPYFYHFFCLLWFYKTSQPEIEFTYVG